MTIIAGSAIALAASAWPVSGRCRTMADRGRLSQRQIPPHAGSQPPDRHTGLQPSLRQTPGPGDSTRRAQGNHEFFVLAVSLDAAGMGKSDIERALHDENNLFKCVHAHRAGSGRLSATR